MGVGKMAKPVTENRNGIACTYVPLNDGIRIYLLPNVPTDAGEPMTSPPFSLEAVIGDFEPAHRRRVKQLSGLYKGREIDAAAVLYYAERGGRFDEFAARLQDKPKDFEYIPQSLMAARTDVTAFFMELLADVGVAPPEEAREARLRVEQYGVGVVILPRGGNAKMHKKAGSKGC
jgi:hypothetical protein